MQFQFGLEHEVAFARLQISNDSSPFTSISSARFADFTNTDYGDFAQIIEQLPEYPDDRLCLRMGDAGIRRKRWYIEGIERFDPSGKLTACIPKGIEIRTTLHSSIEETIAELKASFTELVGVAQHYDFIPIATSFNPYHSEFIPNPPLNDYERDRLNQSPEDRTEHLPMLTYGPDLNLSVVGATAEQTIDWARKLTYYSPALIPFSFSSLNPEQNQRSFYCGQPWAGESIRSFHRTGLRPAALCFIDDSNKMYESDPSLTKMASLPKEIGRIEFKAFDSCGDFDRYASLFALLKGLILDDSLTARAWTPDRAAHQKAAKLGWQDAEVRCNSIAVLEAARNALNTDSDRAYLDRLSLQD